MFAQSIVALVGRPIASGYARPARLRHLRAWMARAWRNHTTRRYLEEADDRILADLGISRAQAAYEASRWMWD